MKLLIATTIIAFSISVFSADLKWNCEKLNLKFNEVPGKEGIEFSVEGCYQEESFFLISNDCKNDPKACLGRGEKKILPHPGGAIGSPAFVQCYRVGGRPRFLQIKNKEKWIDTSTCFFGSEKSFMDFDTISRNKK